MSDRLFPEKFPTGERVHLEKCKICGEWINRLDLEQVVRHLDHSRRGTDETIVRAGSAPKR